MVVKSWPLPVIPPSHTCLCPPSLSTRLSVSDNQLEASVCVAPFLRFSCPSLSYTYSPRYTPLTPLFPPSLTLLGVVRKGCSSGYYSPETGPPASGPDIWHHRVTWRQSLCQREQGDPQSHMQIEESGGGGALIKLPNGSGAVTESSML